MKPKTVAPQRDSIAIDAAVVLLKSQRRFDPLFATAHAEELPGLPADSPL
jgi:hypothetical protein